MSKIISILLSAVLLIAVSLPMCVCASASGYVSALIDEENLLTESQEEDLQKLLAYTALKVYANMGVIITNDIDGLSPREYTEKVLDKLFGLDSDSIVMLVCNDFDTGYDYIYCTGTAADRYHDESHEMLSSFYYGLDHSGYYHGIVDFCEYFGVTEVDAGIISPENEPVTSSYKVNLTDYDECFTASEEEQLLKYMQTTADEIECHIGIVTSSDLRGLNDEKYTIQFYQESFGSGSNAVVLLFCNDHINYDYIYTYGLGTDKFDSRVDDMFDDIYDAMGEEDYDYYGAAIAFCTYMRNHNYETDYNDYYDDEDFHFSGEGSFVIDFGPIVFIAVIISLIVTTISVKSTTNSYKKKTPISARHYLDQSAIKWLDRQDIYLRETNTSVRISSSSSGGGRSRSGGGGRRRSGGGGGRGRRR